jgi:hypothetical protein
VCRESVLPLQIDYISLCSDTSVFNSKINSKTICNEKLGMTMIKENI